MDKERGRKSQSVFSEDDEDDISKFKMNQKKPRCITKAIAEDFSREQLLFSSLVETLIYVVFLAACTLYIIGLKSRDMYYMTSAVKKALIERSFDSSGTDVDFENIKTVSDTWAFLTSLMIQCFYFDQYYPDENVTQPSILNENFILGVPRIRQVRVRNDSCEIHPYFAKMFMSCFGEYSPDVESHETFGLGEGTAWQYNEPKKTKSLPYSTRITTYGAGGFYQDLSRSGSDTKEILETLRDNHWVTRETRAIFVDFSLYNANLNLFCICKLIFELPPTGGVISSYRIDTVYLLQGETPFSNFTSICGIIFYAFILMYMGQSLREFIYFRFSYFQYFWTYVNLTVDVLAITTLTLDTMKRTSILPNLDVIQNNPNKYGNLELVGHLQTLHNDLAAAMTFFVDIRIFKYLNFSKTMGQLSDTLEKCALDILGFSLMFFVIFFAYAELGYLLFGSKVNDFNTFQKSMFTLLRTILGDFDYQSIEQANKYMAPIYFLSYIFLVFFVLLNMFLAIINDTYADVKTELAIAPSELQMHDFLKRYFYRFLAKLGYKKAPQEAQRTEYNVTADQIRSALKKLGFNYLEIEMFFARYNIDPLASAEEFDLNKLMKDLEEDAPISDRDPYTEEKYAKMSDFKDQRKELRDMRATIVQLGNKVDALLTKLQAFEERRNTNR